MREEDLKTREGVYARTVTVKPDIADANGTMTVLAVAANMQEAAGDQLIDLKIGFDVTSSLKLLSLRYCASRSGETVSCPSRHQWSVSSSLKLPSLQSLALCLPPQLPLLS